MTEIDCYGRGTTVNQDMGITISATQKQQDRQAIICKLIPRFRTTKHVGITTESELEDDVGCPDGM